MSFATGTFWAFLLVTFVGWRLFPRRLAVGWLASTSLVFYAWWYPPHVIILILLAAINYYLGRKISDNREKGQFVIVGIALNLAALGLFKYGHGAPNLTEVFGPVANILFSGDLSLIFPIGLSFYTFKAISYLVDVKREQIKPFRRYQELLLYLAFFPGVSAGPLNRSRDFALQLTNLRPITVLDLEFIVQRLLRGLFLKFVIANNLASSVAGIMSQDSSGLSQSVAWAGAFFFAVQIYCDFAGYSDIAIALGRIFGFHFEENFNNPYYASSFSEFWRRWHITLSTWLRDYVYFPLARSKWMNGSFYPFLGKYISNLDRNAVTTLIMFGVSGLWHGATWNFLLWGLLHGLFVVGERHLGANTWKLSSEPPKKIAGVVWQGVTIIGVILLWIPFRLNSTSEIIGYWVAMFFEQETGIVLSTVMISGLAWSVYFVLHLVAEQITQNYKERRIISSIPYYFYLGSLLLIPLDSIDFIYFQF